jgi:hypothetical protein
VAIDRAGCNVENRALSLIDISDQFEPVQHQEDFKRCMAYPFVAVHERVVADKREPERYRLFDRRGIQILAAVRLPRLCDGPFQEAKVPQPRRTAPLTDNSTVKLEYLTQGEVANGWRNHASRR